MGNVFSADLRSDLGLPDTVTLHGLQFRADETFVAAPNFPMPDHLHRASLKRRREFFAGRLCASLALTQAGYAGSTWLARDVDGLPVWPGGWTGSISHSATAALAAVCPRATGISLGVDIEEIAPAQVARDVSSAVGRPDELAVLSKLPAALAVMLLFSAKESLYKALYPQLRTFRDFTAARLVAAEGSRFILRLEEDWGTRWPAGRLIQVHHAQRCGHVITAFQAF